ncbi:MAG: F0F1 ATP synthase subunit B [Bacteroidia bacterium]|nr:F0F1 ATP synthase subunit B [Bacteroidia bacterium]
MGLLLPDFGLFFWMVLSFSVLLLILKRYAWVPILKALSDREKSIEMALMSAENAKEEMKRLQSGNEKILKEAILEREKIVKEARELKESIIRDARHEAGIEANKVLENARTAIEHERVAAISDIKKLIANFSVEIASKILEEKLSDEGRQKELVQDYIDQINLN